MIDQFRANGGVVTVVPPRGPVLILHSMGARTGRECETPLLFSRDGERYVIIASMGGYKRNPDWYYNLVANPDDASIEVGTEAFGVSVEFVHGEERDRLYKLQAEIYPQFDLYRRKTKRIIPVMTLERRGDRARLAGAS